ncbi:hypothetical protein [Streptomyces sp. MP131-18]|uniref:hypothetical protein n=1 Tax=Streptomyces sp. MP131-18 TaxID=1857892 RepID=UPI00097C1E00|nr:hypothetical protein [Streptomyces sp. MP131-18]ONK13275.1 hypothetical protein STBA_40380 [Streptomyces sp. MP131-18]
MSIPLIDFLSGYSRHAEDDHSCDIVEPPAPQEGTEETKLQPCAYCRVMATGERVPKGPSSVYRVVLVGEDAGAALAEAYRLTCLALNRTGLPGNDRSSLRAMKSRIEALAANLGWRLDA